MTGVGLALTGLAALFAYVAAPHRILWRSFNRKAASALSIGAGSAGVTVLVMATNPTTAAFAAVTAAMGVWTVLPPAAAWWRSRRNPPA